jgi:hypothetical protein
VTRRLRLLGDAAKLVDSRSTRSKQRKVGASEIGVCRRRAGYSHHGHPISNPENVTGIAAVVGTWIHKGALATMHSEWGTVIEQRVEDDDLRGHVDGIDLPNDWRVRAGLSEVEGAPDVVEVDDLKTKRDRRMIDYVRNRGPKRSELYQTHLYGDLLRRNGVKPIHRQRHLAAVGPLPVETVRLRYFARSAEEDDAGEYIHEQPFDPDIAAEAWEWVKQVTSSTSPDELPRDEDGPGLSVVCDNCPFRTACWGDAGDFAPQSLLIVTDDDLAATLDEYDRQRAIERDAKAVKDKARQMLDATDPAIYTDGRKAFKLTWGGGRTGDPKPDVDAMVALFAEAGLEVPYLDPKPAPRTIHVTRWEVPEVACGKPIGDPPEVEVTSGDVVQVWKPDRPRGGWTGYSQVDGSEVGTMTAGEAAKQIAYTEERPPCVLKKGHSGDCWPDDAIAVLDVTDDPGEAQEAAHGA